MKTTKKNKHTEAAYRKAAIEKLYDEGTLEVDDNASVSLSPDGGAYVQAWVWVSDDMIEEK